MALAEAIPSPDCPFCRKDVITRAIAITGLVFALPDKYPVSFGHVLIIPRRHVQDYFSMTTEEHREANELLLRFRNQILESDPMVLGFNIGANCGEVAGQTVEHAHIHLIPRRFGDTPNPRGGIRGVLPGKMTY